MKRVRSDLAIAVTLWGMGLLLFLPLFGTLEFPYRGSIEAGYASMARFLRAAPDPYGWNPLVYSGMPTRQMYVPAIPYGTALLSAVTQTSPEQAYRWLTALLNALLAPAIFVLFRAFGRSRGAGAAAAAATLVFSPVYGLIRTIDLDRGVAYLPWRMQVVAKYGENPHHAGFAFLLFTLAAVWWGARRGGFAPLWGMAALMALTVLTNWIAGFALALTLLLLLLAVWGRAGEYGFRYGRVFAASLLAWLLAAFWITPEFVTAIAFNWPQDAYNYEVTARGRQGLLLALGGVLGIRLACWKLRDPLLKLLTMAVWFFGVIVVVFYETKVDVLPESRRYALEWDVFLLMAIAAWLAAALRHTNPVHRGIGSAGLAFLLAVGSGQALSSIARRGADWQPRPKESTIEYRMADWLHRHSGGQRVFVTGGLRYRLNSWFPVPQIGGTFESGLQTRATWLVRRELVFGSPPLDGRDSATILTALGAAYVAVHGPKSEEYYRDLRREPLFAGVLPVAYEEPNDKIYRLPVRSAAHLVRDAEVARGVQLDRLRSYAAAVADPDRPRLTVSRPAAGRLVIEGPIPEGFHVSVQEHWNHDWRATQNGRPVPLEQDALEYLLLRPTPAVSGRIELEYRAGWGPRLFGGLSVLAWLTCLYFWMKEKRR